MASSCASSSSWRSLRSFSSSFVSLWSAFVERQRHLPNVLVDDPGPVVDQVRRRAGISRSSTPSSTSVSDRNRSTSASISAWVRLEIGVHICRCVDESVIPPVFGELGRVAGRASSALTVVRALDIVDLRHYSPSTFSAPARFYRRHPAALATVQPQSSFSKAVF